MGRSSDSGCRAGLAACSSQWYHNSFEIAVGTTFRAMQVRVCAQVLLTVVAASSRLAAGFCC